MTTDLDQLLASVDPSRMTATLGALARPSFAGRRAGSPGGAAARAWLTSSLTEVGAAVTADPFPVRAVPEIYATPQATWHDGTTTRHLTFGRQVGVYLASVDQSAALRAGLADARAADPAGRWLLVPDGMTLFDAYGHADRAAGLLIRRAVDSDGWQYTMLAGPDPGPLPILALDPATHAAVSASIGGCGEAWFAGSTPIRRADVTAANLNATWHAGGRVLLTAHYDGVGDLPGLAQPGAADNASGVAVVLEAARVLAPILPGGLSVALLDAEEIGALGSAHHAGRLADSGAEPWVINVDGAGRLDRAAAVEAGGPAHGLLAVLDQAGRHVGLPLAAGPVASDNRRYAAAGLAAVGIGAGMGGYHSPADTPDRVEPATLDAVCRLVVATAWLATTFTATVSSPIGD